MPRMSGRPSRYCCIYWTTGRYAVNIYEMKAYFESQMVPCWISPLHDKDVVEMADLQKYKRLLREKKDAQNKGVWDSRTEDIIKLPEIGDEKKPHYHVGIDWGAHKTLAQTRAFLNPENWGGPDYYPYVEPMLSKSGFVRYLIHKDNPEKYQYQLEECLALCGASLDAMNAMSDEERIETTKQLFAFAKKKHYTEFAQLVNESIERGDNSMFQMLYDKPSFYDAYMRSCGRLDERLIRKMARMGAGFNSNGGIVVDSESVDNYVAYAKDAR